MAGATARIRVPRIDHQAVVRARLTVVPRVRARARRVPFLAVIAAVLVAGVTGLLLFNTSMQQASFRASELETQAADLTAREQFLRTELERLRDPQRIAGQAERMGMVLPADSGFVDLSTGKVRRDPDPSIDAPRMRLYPLPPPKPSELNPPTIIVRPPAAERGQAERGQRRGSPDRAKEGR
jgi:cell division protein FtsB